MIGKLQNKLKTMSRKLRDEAGATMVEMAIIVVLLFTVVTLIAQGGIVFMSWHAITNGAREGARFAAPCITRSAQSCTEAQVLAKVDQTTAGMLDQSSGDYTRSVAVGDNSVTVTVTYTVPTIGPLIGEIPLSASSTMRLEHPR